MRTILSCQEVETRFYDFLDIATVIAYENGLNHLTSTLDDFFFNKCVSIAKGFDFSFFSCWEIEVDFVLAVSTHE